MTRIFRTFFFLSACLIAAFTQISAAETALIVLNGHLDKETLEPSDALVRALEADTEQLVIEVNSQSGDLKEVLEFAKEVYAQRLAKGFEVVVYIDDSAVGPAALIPFVANDLATSVFVTWGDINLTAESALPSNLLRSQVVSLISSDHPQRELLMLMADAMIDPQLEVVDAKGWRLARDDEDVTVRTVSREGEALVVDHNQLRQLGLISKGLPLQDFRQRMGIAEEVKASTARSSIADLATTLDQRLQKAIKFRKEGPHTIGHIVIDDRTGGITQATWIYVRAALEHYKQNKPSFIILELNTPGGEVYSAQRISDALKEMDTTYGVPVVAYINNWAISAGAMLAYSCRFIAIVKDASMGAAEPVLPGEGGKMEAASEKVNSALRADFGNRASFWDRDPNVAEAMVDKDIILVKRHGKVVRLDAEDQIRKTGPIPDEIISAKGKLLTLNSEQMMNLGVVDIFLPPASLEPITEKEREQGSWPANKNLLFQQEFFKQIPDATIESFQMNWQTHFFAFLATPAVASFLFLGMMLGFYMELNTPGFGLAGSVALACLFLILLSSFSVEAANVLELIIVLVGLVLIAVELFVLPGFGVVGMLGILLFIGGLFAIMLPEVQNVTFDTDSETWNAAGEDFMLRLTWLCGTFVLGVVSIALLARYVMPRMPFLNRLVLAGEQDIDAGYVAGLPADSLPSVGSRGEVLATLRPAGKVLIDDEVYDAVSDGVFLEKGTPIIVQELRGSKLYVESVENEESP